MGSNVDVVRLGEEQIPEAAAVLARAFHPDPFMQYLLPDEALRATALPRFMEMGLTFCYRYGECYIVAPGVQAAAAWVSPGAESTPERWAAAGFGTVAAAMGEAATGRMMAIIQHFEALRERALPGPHWYLLVVGVDPPRQGQGLGGQLLQPVLRRADADGLPCYLETATELDVRFYTRHGFAVNEESVMPGTTYRYWTMIRRPRQ